MLFLLRATPSDEKKLAYHPLPQKSCICKVPTILPYVQDPFASLNVKINANVGEHEHGGGGVGGSLRREGHGRGKKAALLCS